MNLKFFKKSFSPSKAANGSIWFDTSTKSIKLYNNGGTNYGVTKEAFLQWGGANINGGYSPTDAALCPDLGANRFAFFPGEKVTVEYSRDSGETGTDYSDIATSKAIFCGRTRNDYHYTIGNNTTKANPDIAKYQTRITMDFTSDAVYSEINKIILYISTNGSTNCGVTLQTKIDDNDYSTYINKQPISGGSGYNVLNTYFIVGKNKGRSNYVRFIFGCDGLNEVEPNYEGLTIYNIFGFGGFGWNIPSNLARNGHLYSFDIYQNADFPAAVRVNAVNYDKDATSKKYVDDAIKNGIVSGVTWEEYS